MKNEPQADANDHGARATPKNVSRMRHDSFPHPNPLPEGAGDGERATRDFPSNDRTHERRRFLGLLGTAGFLGWMLASRRDLQRPRELSLKEADFYRDHDLAG
jgi:hypothetical protein